MDQFSFCVALYEGLYGERPFGGATLLELFSRVRQGEVKPAPRGTRVPEWLRKIVLRGLRATPDERFASMDALLAELGRDRTAARRRALATAGALVVLGGVAFGARHAKSEQARLCHAGDARIAAAWSDEKRSTISASFAASGVPYAEQAWSGAERVIDGYARSWLAMQSEACEATRIRGEQSEELLDLRMECLGQRRRELESLVDVFSHAEAKTVERAVSAANTLAPLEACANAQALRAPVRPPADPETTRWVNELRDRLAHAKEIRDAGRYAEAVKEVAATIERAKALRYRPIEAEAQLLLGQAQILAGDGASAEQSLNAAVDAAEAGKHDAVAANAWSSLVWVGYMQARYAEAHAWADHARAAIERMGGDERLLASLLSNLSAVYGNEGRTADAIDASRQALAIRERLLGPDHPDVATTLDGLGVDLRYAGKLEEALAAHDRAIAIREATFGPSHPAVATALMNSGAALLYLKRYDAALARYRRALEIRERALGPNHRQLALVLTSLASTLQEMGRYDEALAYHQRALAISEAALGPDHPDLSYPLDEMGRIYLKIGPAEKALPLLERAYAIRTKRPGNAAELAKVTLSLAEAILATGGDAKRARDLAIDARRGFAASGDAAKEDLAETDAWLAKHGGPPP
jgi:tetratricopeptide (TPR) repeat protein